MLIFTWAGLQIQPNGSNHVHLLIREREESVSDTIKRLGVSYSHYYNKKYERTGHLFQDHFKSEPVNDMNYFVTLLRYQKNKGMMY